MEALPNSHSRRFVKGLSLEQMRISCSYIIWLAATFLSSSFIHWHCCCQRWYRGNTHTKWRIISGRTISQNILSGKSRKVIFQCHNCRFRANYANFEINRRQEIYSFARRPSRYVSVCISRIFRLSWAHKRIGHGMDELRSVGRRRYPSRA